MKEKKLVAVEVVLNSKAVVRLREVNVYPLVHPVSMVKDVPNTILRLDKNKFVWSYNQNINGWDPYPRNDYGADWRSEYWLFPDDDGLNRFLQAVHTHGGIIVDAPQLDKFQTEHIQGDWWKVSFAYSHKILNIVNEYTLKKMFLENEDRSLLISVMHEEEIKQHIPDVLVAKFPWEKKSTFTSLPTLTPVLVGGWRVVVDVENHPLAPWLMRRFKHVPKFARTDCTEMETF
jgi:hypothetical protein